MSHVGRAWPRRQRRWCSASVSPWIANNAGSVAALSAPCNLSDELETNVLLTFQKRLAPEGVDVFETFGQREEVVARQRAGFRGEAHIAVGEQELGLAHPAGIEDDLAGCRVAGIVLEADGEIQV